MTRPHRARYQDGSCGINQPCEEASRISREDLVCKSSKRICVFQTHTNHPTVRMTTTYQYSTAVNKALATYGAKTHGSLQRREERLQRFTDVKNRRFAAEIRRESVCEDAREAQKRRAQERIRQIYADEESDNGLHLLCRVLQNEFAKLNRG
jgi:uncharacterized protein YceH (UPF0502 family)